MPRLALILLLVSATASPEHCEGPFKLPAAGGHRIHVEVKGNCSGFPLLYFHGGWGPLTHDLDIVPSAFRVVYFHQRGWGLSEPQGSIASNTYDDIVEDAQRIREFLSVRQRWAVIGGSNGATLALMYASRYPETVAGLVLRGYWAMTPNQVSWDYFGFGKRTIYPEEWHRVCTMSDCAGADILDSYHALLAGPAGDDGCSGEVPPPACAVGCAWMRWDSLGSAISLTPHDICSTSTGSDAQWYQLHPLASARLGVHFYRQTHQEPDIARIVADGIGVHFVTGRFDLLCPPAFAAEMVDKAKKAGASAWTVMVVEHAAHSGKDPGMADALREKLLEIIGGARHDHLSSREVV